MNRLLLVVLHIALFTTVAAAQEPVTPAMPQIETRTVEYKLGELTLRGYLAQPHNVTGEVPGILVIHEWWGLNEFAKLQTRRLAELGYVAFAADMYGEGRTTSDPQEAGKWSGEVMRDRQIARARAAKALEVLSGIEGVDGSRLGAIGYCFGGTVACELGYGNDQVKAVVSFHGNPLPARIEDTAIKARFLILHGTADTLVPDERLAAFSAALEKHEANHRIIRYEGAKHSFTNPAADALNMPGVGYDKDAANKSWNDMRAFFKDVLDAGRVSP